MHTTETRAGTKKVIGKRCINCGSREKYAGSGSCIKCAATKARARKSMTLPPQKPMDFNHRVFCLDLSLIK